MSARPSDEPAQILRVASVAGIGLGILVMIVISVAGPSKAVVRAPAPGGGAPWEFGWHLSARLVTVALWAAALAGGAGVAAGLMAVARGARPSPRMLVAAALIVTAVFSVLPAAGSTDSLDYAAYGRMVVLGHSPYRMTPQRLRRTGDPVGLRAPRTWEHTRSVYGPLATAEEAAAAELGGSSAARIVFWLKVWNALAFSVVVLALDRVLRDDPGRRARAHLLWSLNPLLLWGLVAAGHVDAFAAAWGLLGLVTVSARALAGRRAWVWGLAAGVLVGAAADVKITYALFGLGIGWAARRSLRVAAAAAAGALAVLVPSYLASGSRAARILLARRSAATADNLYRFAARLAGYGHMPHLGTVAAGVFLGVACLMMWRLPEGAPLVPAVRPALAVSLAWLLTWPYQRPWYDAIGLCVLAVYPVTHLDWPVLIRQAAVTCLTMPGMPGGSGGWLLGVQQAEMLSLVPAVRLAVLAAVVAMLLGLNGRRPGALLPPAGHGSAGGPPERETAARYLPAAGRPGPC